MSRSWMFVVGFGIVAFTLLDFARNVLPKIQGGILDLGDLFRIRFNLLSGFVVIVGSIVLVRR